MVTVLHEKPPLLLDAVWGPARVLLSPLTDPPPAPPQTSAAPKSFETIAPGTLHFTDTPVGPLDPEAQALCAPAFGLRTSLLVLGPRPTSIHASTTTSALPPPTVTIPC